MFNEKDIVRIKPEWLGENEDASKLYIVEDVNDCTERCYITELNSKLPLPSSDLVGFEMIEKV